MKAKEVYEVLIAGKWYRASNAKEQPSGWLHADLRDGTTTLARPGRWRKIARKQQEPKP